MALLPWQWDYMFIITAAHTVSLSLCVCVCAGDIRLVNGSVPSEGRVELFYEGKWGRVSVSSRTVATAATAAAADAAAAAAAAARVACRQAGYPYSDGTVDFGQGRGPFWVGFGFCTGDEERIEQCSHNGWRAFCPSCLDLGVRCRGECVQSVKHTHTYARTHTVYQGVLAC